MSRTARSMAAGARDMSPIILGVIPFGLVAGAAVADAGFGVAESLGMSAVVFAGASQLAATSLFAEGAPLWIVIATALVINARMFIYSTSLAPVVTPTAGRSRPFLGYLLTDQAFVVTMTKGRYDPEVAVVPYYAGAGLTLWAVWQVVNVAGVLGGAFVPSSWSLDFAVPLVFIALMVPALKTRANVETVLAAGIAAAILVPLLPLQTGLLAAILIGIVWGAVRDGETDGPGVSP